MKEYKVKAKINLFKDKDTYEAHKSEVENNLNLISVDLEKVLNNIDNKVDLATLNNYATKEDLNNKVDKTEIATTLATKEELKAKANATDLNNYATKEELNQKANLVHTHAYSDLTGLPTDLVRENELNSKLETLQTALGNKANTTALEDYMKKTDKVSYNDLNDKPTDLVNETALSENNKLLNAKIDTKAEKDDLKLLATKEELNNLKLETVGKKDIDLTNYAKIEQLNEKADKKHTHLTADITDLQGKLDLKADKTDLANYQIKGDYATKVHTHTMSDITDLEEKLNTLQPKGNYITKETFNSTITEKEANLVKKNELNELKGVVESKADASALTNYQPKGEYLVASNLEPINQKLDTKADKKHTHEMAEINGLNDALGNKADTSSLDNYLKKTEFVIEVVEYNE